MHTVTLTHAFVRAAKRAGMAEQEIEALVDYLAENPTAGAEVVGTGGCRKLRFAGRGKGKSGAYRIVTFYTGSNFPVFLVTVFSKGERSSLSKAECNDLRAITKALVAEYRARGATAKKET
jgi:hypothetical protein